MDWTRVTDAKLHDDDMVVTYRSGEKERLHLDDETREFYDQLVTKHWDDAKRRAVDLTVTRDGIRFRAQVFTHLEGISVALRPLPERVPTLKELGFDYETIMSTARGHGLLFICGPTEAGKSTTLSAIAEALEEEGCRGTMVTVEQPIEYVHTRGVVYQREVGRHVQTAAEGVREALRQSVDTIVIGEIRDPDAAVAAVDAGLTGHRVLATVHAKNIQEAIVHLWGFLEESGYGRLLPSALAGGVAQYLSRRPDIEPVVVYETIVFDAPARSVVRGGETALVRLNHEMERQKRMTMEEYEKKLIRQGVLTDLGGVRPAVPLWEAK